MTYFGETARFSAVERRGAYRTVYFFILSCLIFASRVERGIPSLAAAPLGPATFPLLSAKAASMISFSWLRMVFVRTPRSGRDTAWLGSHAGSIENGSPCQTIT